MKILKGVCRETGAFFQADTLLGECPLMQVSVIHNPSSMAMADFFPYSLS